MNPSEHMHSKLFTLSRQLPLFAHGAEKHSSISVDTMHITATEDNTDAENDSHCFRLSSHDMSAMAC